MRLPYFSALLGSVACLLACDPDSASERLDRTYEREAERLCPCFAAELGFPNEAWCLSGYRAEYLGESAVEVRCLESLERDAVPGAAEHLACRIEAESTFEVCLDDLTCDDAGLARLDGCELALLEALALCPALPEHEPTCGAP